MRPNNLPPELFFETRRRHLELDIDVLTIAVTRNKFFAAPNGEFERFGGFAMTVYTTLVGDTPHTV